MRDRGGGKPRLFLLVQCRSIVQRHSMRRWFNVVQRWPSWPQRLAGDDGAGPKACRGRFRAVFAISLAARR
jgi:hypothetical protein